MNNEEYRDEGFRLYNEDREKALECFMKAAQKLGVPYRDCLVLEDSSNGIWAAQAAGMQAICIPDLPLQDEKALDHVAAVLSSLDEVCSWLFMSSHGQPVPEE